MYQIRRYISRAVLIAAWLLTTAGIAFVVARAADEEKNVDGSPPIEAIDPSSRATVMTTTRSIVQVVSSEGGVVWDAENNRWLLVASVESDVFAYRLLDPPIGVRALIAGGPAAFDCSWVGLISPEGIAASAEEIAPPTEVASMACAIPAEVRVVGGLRGTMAVTTSEPVTAMALPVSAVFGESSEGEVIVVGEEGSFSFRTVQIGVSDGRWVQIISGLEASERILEFPTQLDLDRIS